MQKNGSSPKFFLKKKTPTNRSLYPKINHNLNSSYKNFLSSNIYSTNRRIKKLNRTSSAFFDRNYNSYIKKINNVKNFVNTSMLRVDKLNSCLFKLKQYYNDLLAYNNSKYNKIYQLHNNLLKCEEKINIMKELKDIDLPDEKIGIKNFNSLKLTKEEMTKNLFTLIDQKKIVDDLMQSEEEYNRTLAYMLESEQNQLDATKGQMLQVTAKLENIKRYQKIVNDNIAWNEKKEIEYNKLKNKLTNDLKLVQEINSNQNSNNERLMNEIMQKEYEIKHLKEQIQELKAHENKDMQTAKNELKEKIKNAKEFEQKRFNDEKKCIDIINSLSIIQRYFYEEDIDDKNFDKNKLFQSKEYQQILLLNQEENTTIKTDNKKYVTLNKETKNNEEINLNRNQKNLIFSNTYSHNKFFEATKTTKTPTENATISATFRNRKKFKEERSFKKLGNKTSSTFYQTGLEISSFYNNDNGFNELITKFNDITMTKEEIFYYISNLISKLEFYKKQMDIIHNKEINLENMKSIYSAKVHDIIYNNYFHFENMTKNNIKCKEFLEKNEISLNKLKKSNIKLKLEKILKQIENNEEINKNDDMIEDNMNNISDDNINITGDNILFKVSNELIINIKNFFFFCSDILKDIYTPMNNNKKISLNTIETDNSKNPFIVVLKKLNEFDKHKDIFISSDFKLLLQYIKNLVKYCKEHNNILPAEFIEEVNSNLIEKFYKPGEVNKKLDKIFISRFLAKKNPSYNNIFNNFTLLSDQVIENVREIYNLIKTEEIKLNSKYLRGKESTKSLIENNNGESQGQINEIGENKNGLNKKKKRYTKINIPKTINAISKSYSNKFEELSEDKDDNIDINETKTKIINIKKKWKVKSLDKRITDKLYKPFLKKTFYLRQINPNIPGIKQMTSRTSKAKDQIRKRIEQVNEITKQINIYNNPNIDTNQLCDDTYNSLVKIIYNNTKKNRKKSGKYGYFFAK